MTRVRPPCNGSKGVTLLELTVTLTILALVGGIAIQALRLGSRSWENGDKRADIEQRTRAIHDVLGQALASLSPVAHLADGTHILAFRGASDWLFFHAAPTGDGPLPFSAMVRSLAYMVRPGLGLVVQQSYPLADGEVSLTPRNDPQVLDPGVLQVHFRYLAQSAPADGVPRWVEAWSATGDSVPDLPAFGVPERDNGLDIPGDKHGGIPLAVEMTVVRAGDTGWRTSTFVFPIRVGHTL